MAKTARTSFALLFVQTLMFSAPIQAASDAGPPADDFWTRKTLLGDGASLPRELELWLLEGGLAFPRCSGV